MVVKQQIQFDGRLAFVSADDFVRIGPGFGTDWRDSAIRIAEPPEYCRTAIGPPRHYGLELILGAAAGIFRLSASGDRGNEPRAF